MENSTPNTPTHINRCSERDYIGVALLCVKHVRAVIASETYTNHC